MKLTKREIILLVIVLVLGSTFYMLNMYILHWIKILKTKDSMNSWWKKRQG